MSVDEKTGIDFPLFQNQVEDYFGEPNYRQFAQDYIVNIDLSAFRGALAHVAGVTHKTWFGFEGNYVLEDPLQAALEAVCRKGLAGQLKVFGGCFNIRPMKSGDSPSMHSWGLAVDFNPATNPFSSKKLVTDFTDDFLLCFAEAGFEWGGLWSSPKDPMHFQLPWIKVRSGKLAPVAWGSNK